MASFVAINPNNSHESAAHDQLLFLEKLRYNTQQYGDESSFVHSKEFNSILKQFKREKQKVEDEKKWENFLETKLHQINTKSEAYPSLPTPDQQVLDHIDFTFQSHVIPEKNAYCEPRVEYTNDWLNNHHLYEGTNFHNNQGFKNYQIIYDLNDPSFVSFNSELPNIPDPNGIRYIDEECYFKSHSCKNDRNAVMVMHLKNEETHSDVLHSCEQKICGSDGLVEEINITEQESSSSDKERICDVHCNSTDNPSIEIKITTTDKSVSESLVPEVQKKEVISSSSSENDHPSQSKKRISEPVNNKNPTNIKNSNINEPEESYCKNLAKKIQDIPGVDNELRKVEDIRIKMRPILANIKIAITKNVNSPLSSDEDLERIKQRTLEFGARFKRNYLYRTNCQVNKLKEMMPNPLLVCKKSKILLVIQKLTAVHNAVIQALQVIEKQLQTISIFGKTQELICSFYTSIYELTLMLKPFYGYLKAQVLDEVEKELVETIELLKDLKLEENFSISNKTKPKKNPLKSPIVPPPWMKKSAALARLKFGPPIRVRKRKSNQEKNPKLLESNQNKDSNLNDQGGKSDQEQDIKPVNFMMSVKQRPGAELRRANFDPIKTEDPKTMIEIISREGSALDIMFREPARTTVLTECNNEPFGTESIITKEKLQKLMILEIPEKTEPRNVKLICIKREDSVDKPSTEMKSGHISQKDDNTIHLEDLLKYRRAFKKYKKNNPLYEKNTLNTVVSMSETFLEETITMVSKEINKMKISDLLGIVDEVESYEGDSLM